jgi:hypothetical protein
MLAASIPDDSTSGAAGVTRFLMVLSFRRPAWRSRDACRPQASLDVECRELELAGREAEAGEMGDGAPAIEQHDERVLAIEELVEQRVEASRIAGERLAQRHGSRLRACAAPGDPAARERRNVSASARSPNVVVASDQRDRASACGQSSSHASCVREERRRRSCATMASCQAESRDPSATAWVVPRPEPSARYGFTSHPSFLATRVPRVAGGVMSRGPRPGPGAVASNEQRVDRNARAAFFTPAEKDGPTASAPLMRASRRVRRLP